MFSEADLSIGVLAAIQLAGLAAAVAVRHHEGTRRQNLWQGMFLLCQLLAGIATISAIYIGPGACTICGAAQALGAIMVVWEVRGTARLPAH